MRGKRFQRLFFLRILLKANSEGVQQVLWPVIKATNVPSINGKEDLGEVRPIHHYTTRILDGQERVRKGLYGKPQNKQYEMKV